MNETDGQGYGSWRPSLSLTVLCSAPSVPEFLRITRADDAPAQTDGPGRQAEPDASPTSPGGSVALPRRRCRRTSFLS